VFELLNVARFSSVVACILSVFTGLNSSVLHDNVADNDAEY